MSEQPRDEPPKYPKSREKACAGCGSLNGWEFRQPVCRSHAPEKESELQQKLHSPTIEFVTRPVVYKVSGQNPKGICELATLMEMLVIPEPEPEELPASVDIVSDNKEARDSIRAYRATQSLTMVEVLEFLQLNWFFRGHVVPVVSFLTESQCLVPRNVAPLIRLLKNLARARLRSPQRRLRPLSARLTSCSEFPSFLNLKHIAHSAYSTD